MAGTPRRGIDPTLRQSHPGHLTKIYDHAHNIRTTGVLLAMTRPLVALPPLVSRSRTTTSATGSAYPYYEESPHHMAAPAAISVSVKELGSCFTTVIPP